MARCSQEINPGTIPRARAGQTDAGAQPKQAAPWPALIERPLRLKTRLAANTATRVSERSDRAMRTLLSRGRSDLSHNGALGSIVGAGFVERGNCVLLAADLSRSATNSRSSTKPALRR